jgi:hypothetical protein
VGFFQALAASDSDQAVLKLVPFPNMVMDVACRYNLNAHIARQCKQLSIAFGITWGQVVLQFDVIVIRAEPVQVLMDKGTFLGELHIKN